MSIAQTTLERDIKYRFSGLLRKEVHGCSPLRQYSIRAVGNWAGVSSRPEVPVPQPLICGARRSR